MLRLRRVPFALRRRGAQPAGPRPRGRRARRLLSPPDPVAAAAFAALDATAPPGRLGVAVSGGGDSVALMLLTAAWAQARGRFVQAATVDHGLRPAAAAEAEAVRERAAMLGLACAVLHWRGWDGRGGLQASARAARTALLRDWAEGAGLSAVALGHTRDDQAETVLMRLARGAGVDGLSAMAPAARREGVLWIRPLLGVGRGALRDWLAARGEPWVDDPSNDDLRFRRVVVRRALAALEPLGIDAAALAAAAGRLAEARAALDAQTDALWDRAAGCDACGSVRLARDALRAAPVEIGRRLLLRAIAVAAGRAEGPRERSLGPLLRTLRAEAPIPWRALHGALVAADAAAVTVTREPAAAAAADPPRFGVWDGRWKVEATGPGVVGALGEAGETALAAARACGWTPPDGWRAAARPARLASPALWDGPRLACAPAAGFGSGLAAAPCVDTRKGGLM